MNSKRQQRIAAAGGFVSVVCGGVAFFLGSASRLRGDDAAIVAVLRAFGACGLLLLVAGARELVLRIEEDGEKGRPSETVATAVGTAGTLCVALELLSVAGLYMMATRLDTLARGSSTDAADIGRFIATVAHVVAGFPGAVFAAAMAVALFALGRAATFVGLAGCVAAAASVLRGFAAYPRTVRELDFVDTSVLFPVRDATYTVLSASFGLFVLMLSLLVWLRADPRALHG